MSHSLQTTTIADLFEMIADPFRIRLLLVLADHEACVCHLEFFLGKRQAYISQHLKSLREAGILTTRRSGKYIFYKLKDRQVLNLIRQASAIKGVNAVLLPRSPGISRSKCACPNCARSNLVAIS